MTIEQSIRKHALLNAIKYGTANPNNVIPKVIGEFPEARKDMKALVDKIRKTVDDVNTMDSQEQVQELEKLAPELLEKKETKKYLKELKNTEKGVIMRFAPSPSGPMHLGHAITGGITALYVKKYKGKFILRIEDTNPDNIYEPAYKMLQDEAKWLFQNVSEVWIQSERMKKYYEYAEKLLEKEAIYICNCTQEAFKKYSDEMKDCPCRTKTKEQNPQDWKKMLDKQGYKEGEAVVRFKAGMQNKNPAMRDFPLFRINESDHPKQHNKYRVWPLMMMAVAVDDMEAGMTHIIRAKDHADNAKKQEMLFKVLNRPVPNTYFTGRYNFEGFNLSASETKKAIHEGQYSGWDDIRLPFIAALRRRGYQPEAFLKQTMLVGLTNVDKTMKSEEYFKSLDSFNKEIIEPKAHRYFFVWAPVKVQIKGAPEQKIELDLHPDNKKGGRKFKAKDTFWLCKQELDEIKEGELVRLMDCLNMKKQGNEYVFDSKDYAKYKAEGKRIIHWLPDSEELIDVEVLMPDNTKITGKGEYTLDKAKVGDIVQLERFGFCRLDSKDKNKCVFWFAHK